MIGLTAQQRRALDFLIARLRATGVPPSYAEIADHLGLKSISGVHRLVLALERRGYVKRIAGLPRSLSVVQLPPTFVPTVTLNSEICTLTDRYAAAEGVSRDTATNQIMREWLEAYFRRAA